MRAVVHRNQPGQLGGQRDGFGLASMQTATQVCDKPIVARLAHPHPSRPRQRRCAQFARRNLRTHSGRDQHLSVQGRQQLEVADAGKGNQRPGVGDDQTRWR